MVFSLSQVFNLFPDSNRKLQFYHFQVSSFQCSQLFAQNIKLEAIQSTKFVTHSSMFVMWSALYAFKIYKNIYLM